MSALAKIDNTEILADDIVRFLKLNGKFDQILDDVIKDRITILGADKAEVEVSEDEVQERFDHIRRVQGLHRAQATKDFLNRIGVTSAEFECYLVELLQKEKIVDHIASDSAVEEYFNLNSPEFDSIEVGHIVLTSEGAARELVALLEDDPDGFCELAKEHSIDLETRDRGGFIGTITRGALKNDLEAKVFNSDVGTIVGPVPSIDGSKFEIFKVFAKSTAELDTARKKQVQQKLYDSWLQDSAKNHRIEIF